MMMYWAFKSKFDNKKRKTCLKMKFNLHFQFFHYPLHQRNKSMLSLKSAAVNIPCERSRSHHRRLPHVPPWLCRASRFIFNPFPERQPGTCCPIHAVERTRELWKVGEGLGFHWTSKLLRPKEATIPPQCSRDTPCL